MNSEKSHIRLVSDLHLEFYKDLILKSQNKDSTFLSEKVIPIDIKDSNTHLVMAGDILLIKDIELFLPFFKSLSTRFKNIIWIFGNHEWFNNKIKKERFELMNSILKPLKNIHILENQAIELDEYVFIGSTMWSDINHGDYLTAMDVVAVSFDYKKITFKEGKNYSNLRPRHVSMMFKNAQEFIKSTLLKYKDSDLIKVVVTHHPPLMEAVPEFYRLNPDWWSDFGNFDFNYLENNGLLPEFWLHGHIHKSQTFKKGKTLIFSNPYGYDDVDKNNNILLNKNYKTFFVE